jgi:hypothetical protein
MAASSIRSLRALIIFLIDWSINYPWRQDPCQDRLAAPVLHHPSLDDWGNCIV